MLLGIHHVAIATTNLERLRDFYCDHLGMEQIAEGAWENEPTFDAIVGLPKSAARFLLLRAGNLALELFQYSRPRSVAADPDRPVSCPGITHFAFVVSDLDAEYARLTAAGVQFHGPPAPSTIRKEMAIRAVYARDPDGNVFELLEFLGETPFDYVPAQAVWQERTAVEPSLLP